jgi:hypothetical protein
VLSLSKLGLVPPPSWLEAYWPPSQEQMAAAQYRALDYCNTMQALGALQIQPPAAWEQAFWQSSQAQLAQFNDQMLSSTMFSLYQLQLQSRRRHGWRSSGGTMRRSRSSVVQAKAAVERRQKIADSRLPAVTDALHHCDILYELT